MSLIAAFGGVKLKNNAPPPKKGSTYLLCSGIKGFILSISLDFPPGHLIKGFIWIPHYYL